VASGNIHRHVPSLTYLPYGLYCPPFFNSLAGSATHGEPSGHQTLRRDNLEYMCYSEKNGHSLWEVLMQRKFIHVPTGREVSRIPPSANPGAQRELPAVFVGGTPARVPPIYTDGWRQVRFDIEHQIVELERP